jgi:hypothetical protein
MTTAKTAVVGGMKIEEVRLKRPINQQVALAA